MLRACEAGRARQGLTRRAALWGDPLPRALDPQQGEHTHYLEPPGWARHSPSAAAHLLPLTYQHSWMSSGEPKKSSSPMAATIASPADSPFVWPRPGGTRRVPPLGAPPPRAEQPVPPVAPVNKRLSRIKFHQDTIPVPLPRIRDEAPPGSVPRPRGVWAKLNSLNALLEPSPAVAPRQPLGEAGNTIGEIGDAKMKKVVGDAGHEGKGEGAAGRWQNRAWLDKLRQELSLASKTNSTLTTTSSPHSHFIHEDAILPPGLGRSPPTRAKLGEEGRGSVRPLQRGPVRPPLRPRRPSFVPAGIVPGDVSTHTQSAPLQSLLKVGLPHSPLDRMPSTERLPPVRHRLRSGGTIEILLSPGQPILVDLRDQSSRAILISTSSDTITVFSQLAPGPLVLMNPAAVYTRAGLPAAYNKVYALAAGFVNTVRTKTPEVSGASRGARNGPS